MRDNWAFFQGKNLHFLVALRLTSLLYDNKRSYLWYSFTWSDWLWAITKLLKAYSLGSVWLQKRQSFWQSHHAGLHSPSNSSVHSGVFITQCVNSWSAVCRDRDDGVREVTNPGSKSYHNSMCIRQFSILIITKYFWHSSDYSIATSVACLCDSNLIHFSSSKSRCVATMWLLSSRIPISKMN